MQDFIIQRQICDKEGIHRVNCFHFFYSMFGLSIIGLVLIRIVLLQYSILCLKNLTGKLARLVTMSICR